MTDSTVVNSWRLKIARADDHVAEARRRIAALTSPSPRQLRISEHPIPGGWQYRIHTDQHQDEMLPAVIGDVLFNLRSALDHLACANVPERRRTHAQYPIFDEDPWRTDLPGTPEAAASERRRKQFNDWTSGMRAEVIDVIKETQPYQNSVKYNANPADHALSILSQYQNADKHRELNIISLGVAEPDGYITNQFGRLPINGAAIDRNSMLPDGGVAFTSDEQLIVEVSGALRIGMARTPSTGHRPLPQALDDIRGAVADLCTYVEEA